MFQAAQANVDFATLFAKAIMRDSQGVSSRWLKEKSVYTVTVGFGDVDHSLDVVPEFHNRIGHYSMTRITYRTGQST